MSLLISLTYPCLTKVLIYVYLFIWLTKCVLNCSTQVCVLGGPVSGWHQQCLLETDSLMVPQWAALFLQREEMRRSQWKWKRDPVIFYRSAETLYNGKWMLPSMTTYCRHFPGVAFKRSASFSSSAKTGASLHHKQNRLFFILLENSPNLV